MAAFISCRCGQREHRRDGVSTWRCSLCGRGVRDQNQPVAAAPRSDPAPAPIDAFQNELTQIEHDVARFHDPYMVTTPALRASRRKLRDLQARIHVVADRGARTRLTRRAEQLAEALDRVDPDRLPEVSDDAARGLYANRVHRPPSDAELHQRIGSVQRYDDSD